MSRGYAYDHAWTQERIRLAGLESALDPGTHAHLLRLGVGPGRRCLEIGAGGGAIALWLAEHVLPNGKVVATDLETDFLEQQAARSPALEVLRHDITVEDLPTDFDLVHARWLVQWLPDKRQALRRMLAALRPGGVLLDDVSAAGFVDAAAEGRCPVVRGGTPPAAHFLRLTLDKLEPALLADRTVTAAEYAEAVAVLNDPSRTIVMPMTVAAWGWRK